MGSSPGPDLRLQRWQGSRQPPKGCLLSRQCQGACVSLTDAQPTARSGEGKCQLLLKGSQERNEISSFKNAPLWHCCQPRDRHPWEKCVGPTSPQEPCLDLKHSRSLGLRRVKAGKSKQGMRGPLYTSIRPASWQHTPRPWPPLKCPTGTL